MKIGFASADWAPGWLDVDGSPGLGGSGWARLGQYKNLIPHEIIMGTLAHRGEIFGVRDWNEGLHFDLDIIVMQRYMQKDVALKMAPAIAAGQIIINEVDDWYWGLPSTNQAFYYTSPQANPDDNRNWYKQTVSNSSGVTVSTQYLGSRIGEWSKAPVTVINNYVDPSRFTFFNHAHSGIPTIGWVGSTSHRASDLEILNGILGIFVRNKKATLQHSGHIEGARLFSKAVNVDEKDVKLMDMVAPMSYGSLLNFDIGLVPLTLHPFNQAKSHLKGLEYAAAGIPFIATPSEEYIRLKEEYGIGRIAKNPKQWIKQIEEFLDPAVRVEEASKNFERLKPLMIENGTKAFTEYLESFKK